MSYQFNAIPFTKVKVIMYNSEKPFCISYKKRFTDQQFSTVCVTRSCQCYVDDSAQCDTKSSNFLRFKYRSRRNIPLSTDKVRDIQSMFPYMPQIDKQFMETIISSGYCQRDEEAQTSTKDGEVYTAAQTDLGQTLNAAETSRVTRSQLANDSSKTSTQIRKNAKERNKSKPSQKRKHSDKLPEKIRKIIPSKLGRKRTDVRGTEQVK